MNSINLSIKTYLLDENEGDTKKIAQSLQNEINNIDNDECYVFAVGEASEKTANRLSVNNKNLYQIKTRGEQGHPLFLKDLKEEINKFIKFAKDRPNTHFIVPTIAYGIAGYREQDIAPMFKDAYGLFNIHLPFVYLNEIYK